MRVFFIAVLLFSCQNTEKKEICHGFDFQLLPIDKNSFLSNSKYSNELDTLQLICQDIEISKPLKYVKQGPIIFECRPTFSFSHEDSEGILRLSYFFYYENDTKKLKLHLFVNFSDIVLDVESLNVKGKITVELNEKNNGFPNNPYDQIIKKIEIKNLKVVSIEKNSGEVWKLVE